MLDHGVALLHVEPRPVALRADLQPLDPAGAVLARKGGRLPDQEEPAGREDAPDIARDRPLAVGRQVVQRLPDPDHVDRFLPGGERGDEVLLDQCHRAGEPRQLAPGELERGAGDVDAGVAADQGRRAR